MSFNAFRENKILAKISEFTVNNLRVLLKVVSYPSPLACSDPERGTGDWTPLDNDKYIGFLGNTVPDPLKKYKSSKRAFNVLCCVIIGPPAKRHLNGVTLGGQ